MNVVFFEPPDGDGRRPGVRRGGKVIDIGGTSLTKGDGEKSALGAVLEACASRGIEALSDAVESRATETFDIRELNLAAPVAPEARVVSLGGVFASHLRERGTTLNRVPAQWFMPDSAIIGPGEPIVLQPRVRENVEPAVELGVVIGRGGKHIDETKVSEHVAGFTIVNDLTARGPWPGPRSHKVMDTFSPCGPHVVPAELIDDIYDLNVEIRQNDRCICQGSTAGVRFSFTFMISFLSSIFRLRAGDVIATGDPGGVTETLSPGSTIELEIDSVGTLSNPVQVYDG